MAEQLRLALRISRETGEPRIAASACDIDWRRVHRRARQVLATISHHAAPDALRDGFTLRGYADDAALLEALRAELAGKRIKREARGSGRMRVKSAVLFAASRRGRRLHALVDQIERRLAAREAIALCG